MDDWREKSENTLIHKNTQFNKFNDRNSQLRNEETRKKKLFYFRFSNKDTYEYEVDSIHECDINHNKRLHSKVIAME